MSLFSGWFKSGSTPQASAVETLGKILETKKDDLTDEERECLSSEAMTSLRYAFTLSLVSSGMSYGLTSIYAPRIRVPFSMGAGALAAFGGFLVSQEVGAINFLSLADSPVAQEARGILGQDRERFSGLLESIEMRMKYKEQIRENHEKSSKSFEDIMDVSKSENVEEK